MAIRYLAPARRALRKHRSVAPRLMEKIQELAVHPESLANNVTRLKGRLESRLRVGEFRVIFLREGGDLLIIDVAPRGNIYD